MLYKLAWWYILRKFGDYQEFAGISHRSKGQDYIIIRLEKYFELKNKK